MLSSRISNTTRKAIYRRDGYRCALCDSTRYLQIHHAIPRGAGGGNTPHNLITLCSNCHSLAHGVQLDETPMTPEDVELACVEYLSDYYCERVGEWNPWQRE